MAEKQLIVAIEGTAAMGPFWKSILSDYLDKIIRCFYGSEATGQKLPGGNAELALVVFHAHGPYSACLVQRSGWTRDIDVFFQWLSALPFTGGGFGEVAIAEGLAEALMMFSVTGNANQTPQNLDGQRHCILVAASNPYALPTPISRPTLHSLDKNDSCTESQSESCLSDAETVAKSFPQCFISLSLISPKHLPKLRNIYNAGKRNTRAADPAVDNSKNPQFLVLLSDNFVDARASLSRPGITSLGPNPSSLKLDSITVPPISGPPPTSIPSVNGPVMNRQTITVGNIPPATVKVEPNTVPPMVSALSHLSGHGAPQGASGLQASSPSPSSQEMVTNADGVQEFKPLVNGMSQPMRPTGPAAANVSILNNLSQVRQVMSTASLTAASSMGLQTMGGTPMAMHMSNMISSGMASSALPAGQTVFSSGPAGITSGAGSGALVGTGQVTQNTALGPFTSASSTISGNSNLGISPALGNLQGSIGMGQSVPGMGPGNLTSGTQIGQGGIGINQNMMNGLGQSTMPSGAGTMIPTPGMTQQVQAGLQPLGVNNGSAGNMTLPQHTSGMQSQSKYLKVWEGNLSGQRQGQPVFICKLEGYRSATASETLAADWPATMQIVRLISQDHMNNKQYVGKADFLVFRALNQHGFLGQLQEKKLCAVIQLPSQTLLLSVSDKASRLIGMLFPGDMVVFKPQMSSQQQQQQQQQLQQQQLQQQQLQQQQLQQQHQQQQQQQMQQQQSQQHSQQQIVGTGMGQTFVQGPGRPQMMSQGQVSSQGPSNMPGGGFLS